MVSIEQAEARLERIVDVKVLFYGVVIGAVVSFLIQLMVPVQVKMNQTATEVVVGWNILGPIRTQDYQVILFAISIIVVAIAIWRVRKVYGLTDRIEEKVDHQLNKTELAEALDHALESLGKTFGYNMTSDLDGRTNELTKAFLPRGYQEVQVIVYIGDKQVRITAEIDRKPVAFAREAKIRITNTINMGTLLK